MPERTTVVYYYDGTWEGMLACIFESYTARELPMDIVSMEDGQMQLFAGKQIITHHVKSDRVRSGLRAKAGDRVCAMLRQSFLTAMPQKELCLLRFARLAFAKGAEVARMLTHPDVLPLVQALTHLKKETELLRGFIRFQDHGGVLVSSIAPKNRVLPLLSRHFCDRYRNEAFLIYDETHKEALLYYGGRREIRSAEGLQLPETDAKEDCIRGLWQNFYETIAIRERHNPTCQRTHMPLRYRRVMTEFEAQGDPGTGALQQQALLTERQQLLGGTQKGREPWALNP